MLPKCCRKKSGHLSFETRLCSRTVYISELGAQKMQITWQVKYNYLIYVTSVYWAVCLVQLYYKCMKLFTALYIKVFLLWVSSKFLLQLLLVIRQSASVLPWKFDVYRWLWGINSLQGICFPWHLVFSPKKLKKCIYRFLFKNTLLYNTLYCVYAIPFNIYSSKQAADVAKKVITSRVSKYKFS